ncbi:CKLF-like MARVEL transmembrane domain-containing protein 2 [Thomomys bottae]
MPPKSSGARSKETTTNRHVELVKESNKSFWLNGHGILKLLSLICLVASIQTFAMTPAHPILPLILYMELFIIIFFMIVYMCAINRYTSFISWPISDFLNDLFCCLFLAGGIYFAVEGRVAMPLIYFIAMVCMGLAACFAFIDMCLQRRTFGAQYEPPPEVKKAKGKKKGKA